jgi:hypothetical protein
MRPSKGLVGERRTDDGSDDLVQIGEPFDRIGEGLLVDFGVLCLEAVADGPVVDSGKLETHGRTPTMRLRVHFEQHD